MASRTVKSNGHQLSFLPTLQPKEDLDDYIVLPGDVRWKECMAEFAACEWFAIDTEYWEDPKLRMAAQRRGRTLDARQWDVWSTRLRLIQIGLPSGAVMIVDFGLEEPSLPIRIPGHRFAPFLLVLGRRLRDRGCSKYGQSLGAEAMVLRRHFGFVLRRVRDTMLASQVLWAGVGSKQWVWTPHGRQKRTKLRHSLLAIGERCGVEFNKEEQGSDWSAPRLSNKQYNYAGKDVHRDTIMKCWSVLAKLAKEEGVWKSVLCECDAAPAFYECEWRGMSFDEAATRALADRYGEVADQCWEDFASYVGKGKYEGAGSQQAVPLALTQWLLGMGENVWKAREGQTDVLAGLYHWARNSDKVKRRGAALTRDEAEAQGFKLCPHTSEADLAPYDNHAPVVALLEARSCRNTEGVLRSRLANGWSEGDRDTWLCTECGEWVTTPYCCGGLPCIVGAIKGRFAARCKYYQIAGDEKSAGVGMGRSSSSQPFNAQNLTAWPLGEKRHKELNLPNARSCARPTAERQMYVGDFSQAHMRVATEASQDPALLDDFRAGRDAHIRLANLLAQELLKLPNIDTGEAITVDGAYAIDWHDGESFPVWCNIYQAGDKKHPVFSYIKSPRQPAKVANYTCLCFGGVGTLMLSAETAVDPIRLPRYVWELTRETWRQTYGTLYQFQKATVRAADRSCKTFDIWGEPGEYGEVWNLNHDRRLLVLKEWNVPQWEGAVGRFSCRGTECVSAVWMMTEANALKDAGAEYLLKCDEKPEAQAFPTNKVHDEIDGESGRLYRDWGARVIFDAMNGGLQRAGIKSIPTRAPDDTPQKLWVGCWADK